MARIPASLRAIKRELGEIVSTQTEDLRQVAQDGLKLAFNPVAVIRPKTQEDVGKLLKLAYKWEVPVTTRGAGSSLTGSATPVRDGWVLDLSWLDGFKIDRKNRIAIAQAGAITGKIQQKALAAGLFYPPDPSSIKWCTIGGNIACNAGGLRCTKYGVTRDYVLALKGFMPNGTPVSWARNIRKFATGYNLRDLWIGSEGTLGVITEATLRLIPSPASEKTWLVAFQSEARALRAVEKLFTLGLQPSICEFLDILSVKGAETRVGHPIFPGKPGRSLLLIEFDGSLGELREVTPKVEQWAKEHGEAFKRANSDAQKETLWAARRKCSGAMFALGPNKLNEDICVPLTRQVELVRFVAKLRKETHLPIAVFGHAGDGNLHVNIMYDRENKDQAEKAESAVAHLMQKVVDLGGAISGEHGVGLAKTPFLRLQFADAEIKVMKSIKKLLDPKGLLNPGKIFEPFPVWEHQPVDIKFPWDHR